MANQFSIMKVPTARTPSEISHHIITMCKSIVPEGVPAYILTIPVEGASPRDCFPVVQAHVRTNGGALVLGWQIWELPSVYVEAEFHAVWRSGDGELVDITPKEIECRRILFLADPGRIYDETALDNIRLPLTSDPNVLEFMAICQEEFEILNRGDRAIKYGHVAVEGGDAARLTRLSRRKQELFPAIAKLAPEIGRNDPCWCGSGAKLKHCHREIGPFDDLAR